MMSIVASRQLSLPLPAGIDQPQLLYSGDGFDLLYKPPGMAVQADDRGDKDLMTWWGRDSVPVGRLDRPTAGIVLAAYSDKAKSCLQKAQQEGKLRKIYRARLAPGAAVLPKLLKHGWQWMRGKALALSGGGKPMESEVIDQQADVATIRLVTGRRHQLRAQLAAEGAPILGDRRYGGPASSHLHLACVEMSFEVCGTTINASLDRSALFALNLAN